MLWSLAPRPRPGPPVYVVSVLAGLASLGPTHWRVIAYQFTRLRDGDRFWYQNLRFSRSELATLESTTLSQIVQRNSGVTGLQQKMFFVRPEGS